jgi:hypothetical protein
MSSDPSRNGADAVHEPDAHGQAAMLLFESLIHGLIARKVLSVADAVEIVDIAVEVREDIDSDLGESSLNNRRSLDMMTAISASLSRDC